MDPVKDTERRRGKLGEESPVLYSIQTHDAQTQVLAGVPVMLGGPAGNHGSYDTQP